MIWGYCSFYQINTRVEAVFRRFVKSVRHANVPALNARCKAIPLSLNITLQKNISVIVRIPT